MSVQVQNSFFSISELKVSYQPKFKASERPQITTSQNAYDIFYRHWNHDIIEMTEQCYMLLLNRANKVIGIKELSSGGMAGTIIDPKVVFSVALKSLCAGIILAHNHPSNSLKPSEADVTLTRRLVEAGKLLDLQVLDHIILTKHSGFYSFADEGIL
ncbi:JAB domain-containing protein [Pedobacter frigoris]|uniref:DNA repair protein n=1 Tax=Pedobacter frigoris TaxID=2571272 RepID=A0A4U1CHY6_9SPHI|nr:JAB domain-containing protein [Pedobacter frigoris]TKC04247.1 DNA repair protein [Pedobacter frigoris]